MQAHLVGEAGDAQARQAARHADRVACAPSSSSARCSAPSAARDARQRCGSPAARPPASRCARARRAGWPAAPRPRGPVALPDRGGEQRREHADERVAPPELGLGARPAPAAAGSRPAAPGLPTGRSAPTMKSPQRLDVAERARLKSPRGACCWRRRASAGSPSSSVRNAVRLACTCSSSGSVSGGASAQGSCSSAKRSGSSAKTAAPLEDQRALAAQRGVDAWLREDARDQALGLVMALADRQRPGGGEQQARPAVELLGRQAGQPLEHGACRARAPSAIRTGCARRARRRARAGPQRARGARRCSSSPCVGQPLRRARMQRRACSAAGSCAKRCRSASRASACMRSHSLAFAGDEAPACRAPAAPGARRRRRAGHRAAQVGMQVVERSAMRVRNVASPASRLAEQQRRRSDRAARRRAPRAPRPSAARIGAARHHRQRELQAERPALGHLVQARAARRRRRASPRRLRTSAIVSSSSEAQLAAPTTAHWP